MQSGDVSEICTLPVLIVKVISNVIVSVSKLQEKFQVQNWQCIPRPHSPGFHLGNKFYRGKQN